MPLGKVCAFAVQLWTECLIRSDQKVQFLRAVISCIQFASCHSEYQNRAFARQLALKYSPSAFFVLGICYFLRKLRAFSEKQQVKGLFPMTKEGKISLEGWEGLCSGRWTRSCIKHPQLLGKEYMKTTFLFKFYILVAIYTSFGVTFAQIQRK